MIEIPLTKNKIAVIDDEDWELVSRYKWHTMPVKNLFYANCSQRILMHRLILNPPKGLFVDHIDRNGLNNRRNNLRIATQSQNMVNVKPRGKYLKGVVRSGRGFAVNIKTNGNRIYLGTFDTELEAHEAYITKGIEVHGEFMPQDLIDNLARLKGSTI